MGGVSGLALLHPLAMSPPHRTPCSHLGGSLGGVVEPRAAQGEVETLPDLAPGLPQLQEALDLRAAPRVEEVLGEHEG